MLTLLTLLTGLWLWASAWRTRGHAMASVLALAGLCCMAVAWLTLPAELALGKVIGRLVMPVGLFWLALLGWCLWAYAQRRAREAFGAACCFVALTLLGNEFLAAKALARLEKPYIANPMTQQPFDAVILLGGGAVRGPLHGHYEFSTAGDRVALAARMHHRGLAPVIWSTGTPIEGLPNTVDSVQATTVLLADLGVPQQAIIGLHGGRNTAQEAQVIARHMATLGKTGHAPQRIGLITSAWHMKRSLYVFASQGLHPTPLPANHRSDLHWSGLASTIPSGEGLQLVSIWAWEEVGLLAARLWPPLHYTDAVTANPNP